MKIGGIDARPNAQKLLKISFHTTHSKHGLHHVSLFRLDPWHSFDSKTNPGTEGFLWLWGNLRAHRSRSAGLFARVIMVLWQATYTSCFEGASSRNLASHVDMDASITQVEQIIAGLGRWTFLEVYAHENKWPLGCCFLSNAAMSLSIAGCGDTRSIRCRFPTTPAARHYIVKGRVEDINYQLNRFNVSQILGKESAGNHINFAIQQRESRQVEWLLFL